MLILSAICHFVRITLFIVNTPPLEAQLSSYGDEMKAATAKVGGIMQNIESKRAHFQEKYSKVCI